MAPPRLLQLLYRSGWEFWLPLPVIAVLFWGMGNLIAHQVLSRPYQSINTLQADTQLDVKLSATVLTINAVIDRRRGVTFLAVKTTDSTLKKLEYEFPTTRSNEIETAIARELEMPIPNVRRLISYRIKD